MDASITTVRKKPVRGRRRATIARMALAGCAFAAQFLHLANMNEQFRVWWGYGVFFMIVAAAQGLLAISLLFDRPSRSVALAGIAGNGFVALIWIVTRIGGIPGVYTFEPLDVVDQGLAATIFACLIVAGLGYSLVRSSSHRPGRQRR